MEPEILCFRLGSLEAWLWLGSSLLGRRTGGRKEVVKCQLGLENGKVLATEARGSEFYAQHPCKKPVCRVILINPAKEGRDRKRPGARSHSRSQQETPSQ